MHQKYDAKSTDVRQNYVRESASATVDCCNLVTHFNMDGGIDRGYEELDHELHLQRSVHPFRDRLAYHLT